MIVTWQKCQCDIALTASLGDALDPVWPISHTAEASDHDELRVPDDRVDIKVDRHVVRQGHEIGETQGWMSFIRVRDCLGEASELCIRSRDKYDISRTLAKIDSLAAVNDLTRLRRQQMHRLCS